MLSVTQLMPSPYKIISSLLTFPFRCRETIVKSIATRPTYSIMRRSVLETSINTENNIVRLRRLNSAPSLVHFLIPGITSHFQTLSTCQLWSGLARKTVMSSGLSVSSLFDQSITLQTRSLTNHSSPSRSSELSSASKSSSPLSTIHLTPAAMQRIADQAKKLNSSTLGLRVLVDSGGCSGYSYQFVFDNQVNSDDLVIVQDGVRLIVDNVSFEYLAGATIDWTQHMIKTSFAITHNPNAQAQCGCGHSFAKLRH